MDASVKVVSPAVRLSLGLSAKEPNSTGTVFVPAEVDEKWGQLYKLETLPEEETEMELKRWHEEGWRGAVSDSISRQVYLLGYQVSRGSVVRKAVWPLQKRLFWRELAQAKTITWKAWHYALAGETTSIDGRLILPSGRTMMFDIQSWGDQKHWVDEEYRMSGGADTKTGDSYGPGAVVAAEVLTPALLHAALRGWYVQRFAYTRGHWAIMEKKLPDFIIEDAWENGDGDEGCHHYTAAQLRAYAKAALKAEEHVATLLEDKDAKASYALYGQESVPEILVESIAARKKEIKSSSKTATPKTGS